MPRPWAFADGGLREPSWFVQEGLPAAVHLLTAYDRWFASWTPAPVRHQWPALADRIGRLAAALHAAGIDHPDLHPGNLLCTGDAPDALQLYLVDYHSLRRGVGPAAFYQRRNLAKLVYGLAQSMPRTDVADVLDAYLRHRDGAPAPAAARDALLDRLYRDAAALERRRLRQRGGARLLSDA